MRVALVCPYAWDRFGGVQSHVRALAATLRTRGHEAVVLAPRSLPSALTEFDRDEGVYYAGRAVPVPANGSMAPLAFGPVAAEGVRRALRELRPEVVHLHEPLIPSLSLLALLATRAPTVGTFHAAAEGSLAYWASRPLLRRAAERLDVRTAVSEAARALVARYFPGRYLITPNGVDVGRFARATPADLGAGPVVLFLGRLERRKGLETAIRAMPALADTGATLVVVGRGPEEASCRTLARRLRVPVRFMGSLHEDLKPGMFAAADVYCAPALGGESFGIVLIEAMAAGTPVVCSDLPGFRAVASGAALLVPPGDPRALAGAVRAVLTDPGRAAGMSRRGRAAAAAYDWNVLAGRVEHIYARAAEAAAMRR